MEVTTRDRSPISTVQASTVQPSVETVTEFFINKYRPELISNISTDSFETTTGLEVNTTAVYEDTSLSLEPTSESPIETTKEETTENMGQVTFFSTAATSVEHTDASSEPNKKTFPILTSTNKAEVTTAAPKTNVLYTTTIEQFDNTESSGDFASGDGAEIELDTDDEDLIGQHQSSRVSKSTAPVIVVTSQMPTVTESTTKYLLESSTGKDNNFTTRSPTPLPSTTSPETSTEQATMSQTDMTTNSLTETSTRSTRSAMSTLPRSLNTTGQTSENLVSTKSYSKSYETDTESTTSSSYTTGVSNSGVSSTENERNDLTMVSPYFSFVINQSHSNLILNLGQV